MAIINQVVSGGGSAPSGKYQLLQRVTDDSNNEIGTVCGFHYDSNNVEYAVVCLDAQYRSADGQYLSIGALVAGLPAYEYVEAYNAKETATFNCEKIMDSVNAYSGRSSTAVQHCHSKTFVIDGVTYVGQLPSLIELVKMVEWRTQINSADITAASNPTLVIADDIAIWSSTQSSMAGGWRLNDFGNFEAASKTSHNYVIPILELPNS